MAFPMQDAIAALILVLGTDHVELAETLAADACERFDSPETFKAMLEAKRVAFGAFPEVLVRKVTEMIDSRKPGKVTTAATPKMDTYDARVPSLAIDTDARYKGKVVRMVPVGTYDRKERTLKGVPGMTQGRDGKWTGTPTGYIVEVEVGDRHLIDLDRFGGQNKLGIHVRDTGGTDHLLAAREQAMQIVDFIDTILAPPAERTAVDAEVDDVVTPEPTVAEAQRAERKRRVAGTTK